MLKVLLLLSLISIFVIYLKFHDYSLAIIYYIIIQPILYPTYIILKEIVLR